MAATKRKSGENPDADDISGFSKEVTDENLIAELQASCTRLCAASFPYFPGSQPVSLTRKKLNQLLRVRSYFVCEKSDGVRYMLYAHKSQVKAYLIDRYFRFFEVDVALPERGTLLDGELLVDEVDVVEGGGSGAGSFGFGAKRKEMKYVAFDCVALGGRRIGGLPLRERLRAIETGVVVPRAAAEASAKDARWKLFWEQEPFAIETKPMYESSQTGAVLRSVIPSLRHGNDGLIFTPAEEGYIPGTCPTLLKWKPPELNTVDFKLSTKARGMRRKFYLVVNQGGAELDYDWVTLADVRSLSIGEPGLLDSGNTAREEGWATETGVKAGQICEFGWDPTWWTWIPRMEPQVDENGDREILVDWDQGGYWRPGGFKFHRVRPDRKVPNDVSVLRNVMQSVQEGLEGEEVAAQLSASSNVGAGAWDSAAAQSF